jgi:CBS-domain-containing membrane protein
MTAVRYILDRKGHQVWSVHPDDTVYDAIKMMADKDVGALVVLDASKIVGIVTERDYARNVFLKGSRIAADAGWRNHGARRYMRWARQIDRGMHGNHDRQARAPPAGDR